MLPTDPVSPILTLAATLTWVEIALVIFFVVFLLITIWVVLQRRGAFDRQAHIPLDDQTITTPRQPDDRNAD